MRDKRFVALHRGGSLSPEEHRNLMGWAISCFERVLPHYGEELNVILKSAIKIAYDWKNEKCSTGAAMDASRSVHAYARTIKNSVSVMVARAIGHGVATAHMADHCMGAALYAQKALKLAGMSYVEERNWQEEQLSSLPIELESLIKETMGIKAKGLGL